MKPKRIILIRHGESEANVDWTVKTHRPNYAMRLTERGHQQALDRGRALAQLLSEPDGSINRVRFYVSPFWRTRDTYIELAKSLPNHDMREDDRLREQDWGHLLETEGSKMIEAQRDAYGSFFYRIENGESCADVSDRITTFLDTLHRDFEKVDFPENVVLVTHGMTMRVFLKRWFHWTTEQFEILANPGNCDTYEIQMHKHTDGCLGDRGWNCGRHRKYDLVTEPRRYPDIRHAWKWTPGVTAEVTQEA